MKADMILKIVIPPVLIFAVLVWLTVAKVLTGWGLYIVWILGFIIANVIVTRITARWSIQRQRANRLAEEKKDHQDE